MSRPDLTVLEGGLSKKKDLKEDDFLEANITDTRLMGVTGLYVHFRPDKDDHEKDRHQFFYLDAEEYGFETFAGFTGDDRRAVMMTDSSLFGGLGGVKVGLSLKEAAFILQEYVRFNKAHGLPLPEGEDDYRLLLEYDTSSMTDKAVHRLMKKQCAGIENENQLINYFVMRCFGKDLPAAEFLSDIDGLSDIYPDYPAATLCKNTIDRKHQDEFLCESLIEYDDRYALVVTEIRIHDRKVAGARMISGFHISSHEAAIALSKSEYITVCDVGFDPQADEPYDLTTMTSEAFPQGTATDHENGRLFMLFNSNNSHVKKRIYMLNDDIYGVIFLSAGGQFILASYDELSILSLEQRIQTGPLADYLSLRDKYKFKDPVLYEFMQGDFLDFDEFLDYLRS